MRPFLFLPFLMMFQNIYSLLQELKKMVIPAVDFELFWLALLIALDRDASSSFT